MNPWIVRGVIPVGIVAASVAVALVMIQSSPKAEQAEVSVAPPAVRVHELTGEAVEATVTASGVVMPTREIMLSPELSGRVTWVSSELIPGGRVKKGEPLARIDARDYKLGIVEQESRVESAKLALELEQGRGEIALSELRVLGKDPDAAAPVVTRRSQLSAAERNLAASQSGLARARLSLERTVLRAPFNATVITEHVDVGQLVNPQTQVARLVGTDKAWAKVSIPFEELTMIQVPLGPGETGSPATVRHRLTGSDAIERQARVLRLVHQLDEKTRRAQLLLEIEAPFDVSSSTRGAETPPGTHRSHGLPLLPGSFVQAEIKGPSRSDVHCLPRSAVQDGRIWTVAGGVLSRRDVKTRFRRGDDLCVSGALSPGDLVSVTRLQTPVDGMAVTASAVEGTTPLAEGSASGAAARALKPPAEEAP